MAIEKPEVRLEVEFGNDKALAIGAAFGLDLGDAVEHQHGWGRQTGIHLARQFATAMGQKLFIPKCVLPIGH
ncbi:hypothetical protein GCM10007913_43870 [Devosia yakushimensis]|uniref:Uncharacterized protein n=1 Tax=Devosia yakushimensis TaxID=470028 RepID=A0ABQ5UK45_9HYPH|nr:hypothetical protein GCM10007913_43870 [Devosia yakushimensis]